VNQVYQMRSRLAWESLTLSFVTSVAHETTIAETRRNISARQPQPPLAQPNHNR
jgi:hypothetical protein